MKTLVVEGEEDQIALLRKMLERTGIKVTLHEPARAVNAIEKVKKKKGA